MHLRKFLTGAALLALAASSSYAVVNPATGKTVVVVTSDISANTTWTSSNEYVLQGSVGNQGAIRVLPGFTLTIQAGTTVRGQPKNSVYDPGSLVVLRGAKIIANGTSGSPIIFTTAATDNNADGVADGFSRVGVPGASGVTANADKFDETTFVAFWDGNPAVTPKSANKSGLWGGVFLLGCSQVNEAYTPGDAGVSPNPTGTPVGATAYSYGAPIIEGFTSPDYEYGHDWLSTDTLPAGSSGTYVKSGKIDIDDNSGELSYLSIRHGGSQLSVDNEINGLTLGGVGRGTKIDYIEVWGNEDDGIEIFGGTVNLKHLAIFTTKDDGLDIDQGYQGQVQYVLVVAGGWSDHCLEWDGDDASGDAGKASKANYEPRGSFEVRNVTMVSLPTQSTTGSHPGEGLRSRRNCSDKIYNVLYVYGTQAYDTDGVTLMPAAFGSQGAGKINATPNAWATETTLWTAVGGFTRFGSSTPPVSTGASTVLVGTTPTTNPGLGTIISERENAWPTDLVGLYRLRSLNPRPGQAGASVPAYQAAVQLTAGQIGFFEQVGFRGAFSNQTSVPLWTNGWTAANLSGAIPTL